MKIPDWRKLGLNEGVLPEPGTAEGRLVLWLPGGRDPGAILWERVGNVPSATITVEQGVCVTPAVVVRARQRVSGFFGKLWQRVRDEPAGQAWVLPSGESAQQAGEKETDLLLVWAAEGSSPLDETRLRERWPTGNRFQQIGKNLFLVGGITPSAKAEAPHIEPVESAPLQQAELLLAEARKSADLVKLVSALTDLGIASLRQDNPTRAVQLLEEALELVRPLSDPAREADILGNLGLAHLVARQVPKARRLFDEELALAQRAGNRVQEKLAYEHLGHAICQLGDPSAGMDRYDQALALARELGDWHQEADLYWYQAIQYADANQREDAIGRGQKAIDLLRSKGSPEASLLTDHLHKYRLGEAGLGPAGAGVQSAAMVGGSVVASSGTSASGSMQSVTGPGLLRMGLSLAKSLGKFVGTGLKTTDGDSLQRRLRTCATCEHHTGMRCRVCGCFTNVKAKMAHEACPLGRWPV